MKLKSLCESAEISKHLIDHFGTISIYRVNGEQVRSISSDFEEFNGSASHQIIDGIPKNEGWVEDTISDKELPYIIHGIVTGIMLGDYWAGELAEKAERAKICPSKNGASGDPDPWIYEKKLCSIFGLEFHLINADAVRNQYKVDFALGGNHGVYDWVPDKEIWLDAAIHPNELPFIALHEFFERSRMLNDKLNYDDAHEEASKIEWKAREWKKIPQQYSLLMSSVRNAINR